MTLRTKLTLIASLLLLVSLAVLAVVFTVRLRESLLARSEREVTTIASAMVPFARQQVARVDEGRRPLRYQRLAGPQIPERIAGSAVAIRADGTTLPLPQLTPTDRHPPVPDDVAARAAGGSFRVSGPDGDRQARVVRVPGTDAVVFASIPLDSVDETVADLVRIELVTGIIVVALGTAIIAVSMRRGLRPLDELGRVAEEIGKGNLSRRAPVTRPGSEVGRLSVAMNDMLARIERTVAERDDAQRRTEQFAVDAAHELRTPITAVLGYAQLYAEQDVDAGKRSEVFGRIEHEASRLRDLTENLLELDRLAGADVEADSVVDPVALCEEVAEDSMVIDASYPISVHGDGQPVAAPRLAIVQIVANLLANVRVHTPPGTRVDIHVAVDGGLLTIDVADNGPGIPPADGDRVFDRFHRSVASARRRGSGLGLAIVRAVARRHGGDAVLAEGRGATVRVTVPVRAPDGVDRSPFDLDSTGD